MIEIKLGKMYKIPPHNRIVIAEHLFEQRTSGRGIPENEFIKYVAYQSLAEPDVWGHTPLKYAIRNWIEVGEEW